MPWAKPRFRFEAFWVRLDGFEEVVRQAWDRDVPNADACRVVDVKLRATAKALQSWSMRNVGSVRAQLFMAREFIAQLDAAQEVRSLSNEELSMRKDLKMRSLGLASLARTIARQRSLYADDMVVLLAPTADDLNCLSEILRLFAGASGLVTNFDKCVITQIRCDEETVAAALQVFPCTV
jgi:hypothetical protein